MERAMPHKGAALRVGGFEIRRWQILFVACQVIAGLGWLVASAETVAEGRTYDIFDARGMAAFNSCLFLLVAPLITFPVGCLLFADGPRLGRKWGPWNYGVMSRSVWSQYGGSLCAGAVLPAFIVCEFVVFPPESVLDTALLMVCGGLAAASNAALTVLWWHRTSHPFTSWLAIVGSAVAVDTAFVFLLAGLIAVM